MQAFFQSAHHLYEKREGSGSIPLTDPDPGCPKTCVSVSPALIRSGSVGWMPIRIRNRQNDADPTGTGSTALSLALRGEYKSYVSNENSLLQTRLRFDTVFFGNLKFQSL